MSVVRVFVALGSESLDQLTAKFVREMLAQKTKVSISVTIDPLFGPALLLTHARQVDLIVVRPNVRSIEKTHRHKVDAVLFVTAQLCTDGALKALVKSVSEEPMQQQQHSTFGAVWPRRKCVAAADTMLDLLF